jgi:ABC-2 type transport system ATP-binding protein
VQDVTTSIQINELTRRFGDLVAVNGVNLDVQRGEVFGFLGPNGAGKSTTVKQATTLLQPTRGTIVVEGYDVRENPVEVRQITGLLPEDGANTHYDRMTAAENLRYYGQLYGVDKETLESRITELLEFFELTDRTDDNPATFSTGLKQKLSLARALVHDPPVVFLDEPTSSLDPIMSAKVRSYIDAMGETKRTTFFVCTHLLTEAEAMCDRVAFISNGKVVEIGRPNDLRRKFWTDRTFEVNLVQANSEGKSIIESTALTEKVWEDDDRVVYMVTEADKNNPQIVRALVEAGLDIVEIRERIPSLEDVYFRVIGGKGA